MDINLQYQQKDLLERLRQDSSCNKKKSHNSSHLQQITLSDFDDLQESQKENADLNNLDQFFDYASSAAGKSPHDSSSSFPKEPNFKKSTAAAAQQPAKPQADAHKKQADHIEFFEKFIKQKYYRKLNDAKPQPSNKPNSLSVHSPEKDDR